ncbi:hypothetical protein M3Y94_00602100 [Aphelenchoides besseyi]|nr:hypothetical protein M3Y94_00602100 [Aphelenchoides besseyi]
MTLELFLIFSYASIFALIVSMCAKKQKAKPVESVYQKTHALPVTAPQAAVPPVAQPVAQPKVVEKKEEVIVLAKKDGEVVKEEKVKSKVVDVKTDATQGSASKKPVAKDDRPASAHEKSKSKKEKGEEEKQEDNDQYQQVQFGEAPPPPPK